MARIAIFSDIHANINALDAVMEHLYKNGGAERIYCLGDVIGYGPKPLECLAIARQHFQLTLKGNHEEAVVHGAKDFNDMAKRAIDWTRHQIMPDYHNATEEQRENWAFVSALPERFAEGMVQLVHGAPQDPVNEYIMPMDIDPPTRTYGQKLYTSFTMTDWVTFCGHSHMPALYCQDGLFISPTFQKEFSYKLQSDLRYIINVGSVGQPRDGDNRACYVTFDGKVIAYHRVPYDFEATKRKILSVPSLDPRIGERLGYGR